MEVSPAFAQAVLVESKPAVAGDSTGRRSFIVAADAEIAAPAKE